MKATLEEHNLSVYVDRYSDPQMSPENVTPDTAEVLRRRMRQSNALLYVHSHFSTKSRWMPWELGFFDGLKGRVGVLPIVKLDGDTFKGEEYLILYPYVDRAASKDGDDYLWINRSVKWYAPLFTWIQGKADISSH